jgi:hypothetical protein
VLDWRPSVHAPELAALMVDAELAALPDHRAGACCQFPGPGRAVTADSRSGLSALR